MQIFLVVADDVEGNNRDQVVWAVSPERALELWKTFQAENLLDLVYDPESDDERPSDEQILRNNFEGESARVFAVTNANGDERVLPWQEVLEVTL